MLLYRRLPCLSSPPPLARIERERQQQEVEAEANELRMTNVFNKNVNNKKWKPKKPPRNLDKNKRR